VTSQVLIKGKLPFLCAHEAFLNSLHPGFLEKIEEPSVAR